VSAYIFMQVEFIEGLNEEVMG